MSFRLTAAAPAIRSLLARPPTMSSRQFVRKLSQNSGTAHTHGKKDSDLPWIIGAVAFTVPSSLYLLSGSSKPAHHSPAGHAPKEEKGSSSDKISKAKPASQSVSETASSARDQASEATGKVREKASGLYDEAKDKAKAPTVGATDAAATVKEKSGEKVEDLTGEAKADEYIGSDESSHKEEGEGGKEKPSDIDEPKAGMKEQAGINTQSGKQEGISNQDTKHAILDDERGQAISKKSEGAHETAKLKGTVDPSREAK